MMNPVRPALNTQAPQITIRFCIGAVLLCCSYPSRAADPPAIQKAKELYLEQAERLRASLLNDLAKAEKIAARKKDEIALKAIQDDRDALLENNILPSFISTKNYVRGMRKPRTALRKAYENEIDLLLGEAHVDAAQQMRIDFAQLRAPKDATQHGTAFYRFFPQFLTWKEAKARCEDMDGTLVIIRSPEDQTFVLRLIEAARAEGAWLGATDEESDGVWMWIDGTPMTFSNWGRGVPAPVGKADDLDYLAQWTKWSKKWHPLKNDDRAFNQGYVCVWE